MCVGIILCFFTFSFLADKNKIKGRVQNFALLCGVVGITLGLGSAVLFQALYNIETLGRFEITQGTGATFYGGLVGGASVFLILWFGVGHFVFKDGAHKKSFFAMASCAAPSIAIAHSLGRVGCLMAGCCHGSVTDAWYGIMMYGNEGYEKYVPIQLFEAIFLFLIFASLFVMVYKRVGFGLSAYMCGYGVWRFLIEYARDDYRGSIPFVGVTPSQFIALLMIVGSVGVFLLEKWARKRFGNESAVEKVEA